MTTLTMTRWQVTITNGKRPLSRISPCLGKASAVSLGERWAKAMTTKADAWRFVGAEEVAE